MADNDEALDMIVEYSEDVSEAEAPEPLPKDDYHAQIREATPAVSKTSGNRYADVVFFIQPEDYPADYPAENAPDGTTIHFRRVSLEDNPASRFRMRQFCENIGAVASKRIDLTEWVGLVAKVTIDHESYEGIPRAVISRVSRID